MDIKTPTELEFASIHDAVLNSIDKSVPNDQLLTFINNLPEKVIAMAQIWGWGDTEVRDLIYEEAKKYK